MQIFKGMRLGFSIFAVGFFGACTLWAGASGPGHQHSVSVSDGSSGNSFAQSSAPPQLPNGGGAPAFSPPPPPEPVRLSSAISVDGVPPAQSRTERVGRPGRIRRDVSSIYGSARGGASEVRTVFPRSRRATRPSGLD